MALFLSISHTYVGLVGCRVSFTVLSQQKKFLSLSYLLFFHFYESSRFTCIYFYLVFIFPSSSKRLQNTTQKIFVQITFNSFCSFFILHFFLPFSHTNKANSNTSKQTRTNIDPPIQSLCLFPLVPLDQTNKLHLKLHINLVKSQKKKKNSKNSKNTTMRTRNLSSLTDDDDPFAKQTQLPNLQNKANNL